MKTLSWINKIIFLSFLILLIFWTILFSFKDIDKAPSWIEGVDPKLLLNKNIEIKEYDLKKYNIKKEDYKLVHDYIASFYKSSIINIDNNSWILYFSLAEENSIENKKVITDIIDNTLKNFNNRKTDTIYMVDYSVELSTAILNDKYNFKLDDGKDFFQTWSWNKTIEYTENNLLKLFDKDQIDKLEKNKTYDSKYAIPAWFYNFWWKMYPKNTVFKMKYLWKTYKKWFDINESTYPIIYVKKTKKEWDGILLKEYNKKKKIEIDNIYNNFSEHIANVENIVNINDDKNNAIMVDWIFNFTNLTPQEYFDLFLKSKWFKMIKSDDNKLYVEIDYWYYIFYFDKDKKYKYDIDKLPQTTYLYKFNIEKQLIPSIIITEKLFNKINNDITEKWYPALKGEKFNMLGGLIIN